MSRKTLPEILERFTNVAVFPELPLSLKREVLKNLSAEMAMQQNKIRCLNRRINDLTEEFAKAKDDLESEKKLLDYLAGKLARLVNLI